MKLYTLHQTQTLPISVEEAWTFLSEPQNLETITPDDMKFEIVSGADRAIYPGQIIQYKISPFPGIKLNWVTEITHVVDNKFFVDEQRFGPYAFWHHKHFLTATPNGVLMEDIVNYRLPFGFLGKLAHPVIVRPKLKKIFEYRRQKLIQLFGQLDN